jgi:acyl-CoA dehydrogenase
MTALSWLAMFLIAIGVAAYLRLSLILTSALLAAILVVWTSSSDPAIVSVLLIWPLFLGATAVLHITTVRRFLISDRILVGFRRIMPSMSQTESDALEAGTVWWDGELFSGRPDWKRLLAFPVPVLSAEEQAFIDGPVNELCRMIDDWRVTEEFHDLPPEVWQFIKDHGFFGMIIPKQYGGLEFSALAHSSVVMKIATRSITSAVTVMVPNSLGPAELLLHYGTEEQKNFYLPRLARGDDIPCFALTGPEAGSDASSIPDRGVVCRSQHNGEEVLGIRLNWDKRYITLGPVATLLGLAFKLYDPDHLLGEQEDIGITLALIPTTTDGVWIGNRHAPLNLPFQNGPNRGKDVFIPMDWVIGGQAQVGNGWRMLMESLAAGRSISLPALSAGAGKLSSRATGAYARIREQFRTPVGKFEGVEEALARIAGYTYMMDAVRTMTAGAVDLGEKPSVISAIAKYNLTNTMRQVVNDAMDVQGGSGICLGPRNLLGRVYQAIPVSITVEGANILTRSLITYGQGAIRCHPYVLQEMQAVADANPQRGAENFDKALFGHIGFTFSNAVRSVWLGLTGGRLLQPPGAPQVRCYYQRLTRMSSAFALCSDFAMLVLGGSLKRREKLSGRLADVLSQMYLVSAMLKRFEDQGRQVADLPLLRWSCDEALYTLQQSLDELIRNFPNRPIAWLMRLLVFPLGRHYSHASDRLGHQVAALILSPSAVRDRLTVGVYTNDEPDQAIGRIECALRQIVEVEDIEKRLAGARRSGLVQGSNETELQDEAVKTGILSEKELELLRQADAARRDVIQVDDFPQDYWLTLGHAHVDHISKEQATVGKAGSVKKTAIKSSKKTDKTASRRDAS